MPDLQGEPGPSGVQVRHPYASQTLLSSRQLCNFIQVPRQEVPGFNVRLAPSFDVIPPTVDAASERVTIGKIMHGIRETALPYSVATNSLAEHAFIAGMTGSGKTNTIFHLLTELPERVKFLVIEPAKAEYRALLAHPKLLNKLRVFTPGNESVAPFRLNPFEVPKDIAVSEHLDLLRAAFGASFGMWTPLPQVLERCLHEVYVDRGWDLRSNHNGRLGESDARPAAFPTLSDLIDKVREVAPLLGYEDRITSDIRAALTTRFESLRAGGKGAMFDVERSIPLKELLAQPTVIELENMGNDDDKAFFMALFLIRLVEYRRVENAGERSRDIQHILVIEEAHRLLTNVPPKASEESANPRGQAVETFTNLLSEIRAYGQGIVIADQIPVRLAPDVIKNTKLKIAHQIVAADDREAMAGAMDMEEKQSRMLTQLERGDVIVFSKGADGPVMVRVPPVKDKLPAKLPDHQMVAKYMREQWWAKPEIAPLLYARAFCAESCKGYARACDMARRLSSEEYMQRTLARLVLSTIDEVGALDRMWDEVVGAVAARRPETIELPVLLRAFLAHGSEWYAARRGAQNEWTYDLTQRFEDALRRMLLEKLEGISIERGSDTRNAFRELALSLHRRKFPPYPACDSICDQREPVCLYRRAVADMVTSRRYQAKWRDAEVSDEKSQTKRRTETWEVCKDAAFELVEFPRAGEPDLSHEINTCALRVSLCFAQQMLAADIEKTPQTAQTLTDRILDEASL